MHNLRLITAALIVSVLTTACGTDRTTSSGDCSGHPRAPVVTVGKPNGGETIASGVRISWVASDPDTGQTPLIIIDVEYSADAGSTWQMLVGDEPNDGDHLWDVSEVEDGTEYLVRVTATDPDGHCASDQSDDVFAIRSVIEIIDRTGKVWDITHAVRVYGMQPGNWGYGLGPFAIRPINNPRFLSPGDARYPLPSASEIIGLAIEGDVRAYPKSTLSFHEVVNDVVGGNHVAVTY